MPKYTFDTKVWVNVTIEAPDKETAEAAHDEIISALEPGADYLMMQMKTKETHGVEISKFDVEQEGDPDIEIFGKEEP